MAKKQGFKQQIVEGFSDVLRIWWSELKLTFRDQGAITFLLFLPLFYPLLYAFIYNNETVHEVPIVVVDESHSSLSRDFLRKMNATSQVRIIGNSSNMLDAQQAICEREAYGIVRIPSSFASDLYTGRQTRVGIYCDMSGLLYYKAILTAATDVSLGLNAHVKVTYSGNTTNRQDEITEHPIAYKDIAIFNPTAGFAAFLIPAVLILVLQQVLLLGIGLLAGTQRENNRFRDLVPINRHYHGTLRIVLGKSLWYFMLFLILSIYVLVVVPKLFSLNQIGHYSTLLAFIVPYLLACIFFSMTCSIFVRNRENCMPIFVFSSLPLLFISGISWPGASVPDFWRVISWLFPSTFGINGYVRINNMGALLSDVSVEYQALWLQTGFYFMTTCWVYRRQIYLSRKHFISYYRDLKQKQNIRISHK
ncbi:MAG: ABC transporter permease [Bacteroidaceae bacterium]|nr:ABC transporter permease [Bacteroidaceae bacterium]